MDIINRKTVYGLYNPFDDDCQITSNTAATHTTTATNSTTAMASKKGDNESKTQNVINIYRVSHDELPRSTSRKVDLGNF
ncbi:hypothetical protein QE152_g17106 [Popillia japonica]|uniref:Uncharacterized protein n=1 Tax=Popillia japonica TaxID=7064 RepID=A0AAW1L5C2_POPJA